MDEFWKSLTEWFKEKTSSPFYTTFFAVFIIWNWRILYTLFFEDTKFFREPKANYVYKNFFVNDHNLLVNFVINELNHVIYPFFLSMIIFYALPYINRWSLKIHLNSIFFRKKLFEESKLHYMEEVNDIFKKQEQLQKQNAAIREEIDKNITQEEKWNMDLDEFRLNPRNTLAIDQVYTAVYQKNGYYMTDKTLALDRGVAYISDESLSRADTNGLIMYDTNKINMTEKGKHFIRRLQQLGRVLGGRG